MGRFDKLREEKGGLAQRFNFSISCNKKEKVAPCKKGTLKVANLARSTFSILLNDQKLHSPLKNWTWHFHRPGPGSLRRWIGLWRDGGWGWCYVWVGCRWCLGWWWCWLASSLLPRSAKRLQPAHGLRSVAPPPGLRVSGREWCEWVSEWGSAGRYSQAAAFFDSYGNGACTSAGWHLGQTASPSRWRRRHSQIPNNAKIVSKDQQPSQGRELKDYLESSGSSHVKCSAVISRRILQVFPQDTSCYSMQC